MSAASQHGLWAVVPAAGRGTRMGSEIPKQYLHVAGRAVIQHTVERLAAQAGVAGVVLALAADDRHWAELALRVTKPVVTVVGGAERCHSVLAALAYLQAEQPQATWAMVHDAARPCVRPGDLANLIDAALAHPVGALLATPVRDTMKRRAGDGSVAETVDRRDLWHALTPQLFRVAALHAAINAALEAGHVVTDEAQAMELAGQAPLLVPGHPDNIKVTEPYDRQLAELYLLAQHDSTENDQCA